MIKHVIIVLSPYVDNQTRLLQKLSALICRSIIRCQFAIDAHRPDHMPIVKHQAYIDQWVAGLVEYLSTLSVDFSIDLLWQADTMAALQRLLQSYSSILLIRVCRDDKLTRQCQQWPEASSGISLNGSVLLLRESLLDNTLCVAALHQGLYQYRYRDLNNRQRLMYAINNLRTFYCHRLMNLLSIKTSTTVLIDIDADTDIYTDSYIDKPSSTNDKTTDILAVGCAASMRKSMASLLFSIPCDVLMV